MFVIGRSSVQVLGEKHQLYTHLALLPHTALIDRSTLAEPFAISSENKMSESSTINRNCQLNLLVFQKKEGIEMATFDLITLRPDLR